MQVPLEIVFHNLDRSAAVEAEVRKRVAKLEQFADNITSCRVTVEAPHKHHQQGNLYSVRVDLHFPGGEAHADRSPSEDHAHEDVYVALRDAFKAARRQLQDRQRIRRGDVKRHAG
jgi:ribosomal subunit interface protein